MRNVLYVLSRRVQDRRAFLLIFAVVAVVAIACGRDDGSAPGSAGEELPFIVPTVSQANCVNHVQPEDAPVFSDIDTDQLEPLVDGIRFYDVQVGTGDTPTFADSVSIEYTGWLEGGCMFDTSYPNEEPINFPVLQMIRGWQQGFTSMQEGGVRVLEVSPEFGFGAAGSPPRIPPNATLIFHINLINRITIQEAEATVQAEIATATAVAIDSRATIVAGGIPEDLPPSCQNSEQPDDAPAFGDIDFDSFETLVEGVRFYDIEVGEGESPALTDDVDVEYTGWLESGCIFDTSYPDEGPITFPLNGVIEGWQEGLSTMKPGGVRVIEIAPELAYGQRGSGAAIPPNATIIFHVELLGDEPEPEEDQELSATGEAETDTGIAVPE